MPSGLLENLDRSERPPCSRAQATAEDVEVLGEPRQSVHAWRMLQLVICPSAYRRSIPEAPTGS
jgi:hypothetical protein